MKIWAVCGIVCLGGCAYQLDETTLDDPLPSPPVAPVEVAAAEVPRPAPPRPIARPSPPEPDDPQPSPRPAPRAVNVTVSPPPPSATEFVASPREEVAAAAPAGREPEAPTEPEKPAEDHYHRDFSVPGDHVIFQLAGGSLQIWLASDRPAFRAYSEAMRGGDSKAVQAIRDKGLLKFVAANTKGVVLEVETGARRVRLAEGTSGWIDEDHLRAEPPPDAATRAKEARVRELARQKDVKAEKDAKNMEAMLRAFGPAALPAPKNQPLPAKKRKEKP